MNSFEHLETRVVLWHRDRNLIEGSTDAAQHTKLVEEVKELETNILLSQPVVDDIGDCLVVLINIAERNGLSLLDCLSHAYEDIKDRKGKMVDGVFVKERVLSDSDDEYLKGFRVGSGETLEELTSYDKGLRAGLLHKQGKMVDGVFVKERVLSSSDDEYLKGFRVGSGETLEELTSYDKGLRAGLLHKQGGKA